MPITGVFCKHSDCETLARESAMLLKSDLLSVWPESGVVLVADLIHEYPGLALEQILIDGKPLPAFHVDFSRGQVNYRADPRRVAQQSIVKAMGVAKLENPQVLDLTAGLARDAYILAAAGCHVTAVEQNPLVYCLTQNGLQRARQNPDTATVAQRITLLNRDSLEFISEHLARLFDAVLIDPMFPASGNSAKVKKDMQVMQLITDESDTASLLSAALRLYSPRVVIKQPVSAPPIASAPAGDIQKPVGCIKSKTVRYDIYRPVTYVNARDHKS